jgi:hypothetical protein
MTPKLKKIIIAIVVLGILFVLYSAFLKPDPGTETLVSGREGIAGSLASQDAQVIGSQISQALLKIEQITLERAIFDNPIFSSLEDRSQPIIDEPIGRTNPFAPLGDTSVNVSTRTNLNMATSTATSTRPSGSPTATSTPN